MAAIVRQWRKTEFCRQLATANCQHLPSKFWHSEIGAQFEFVRRTVRYIQDPNEVELLQSPEETWKRGAGDCDDQCIYLQSLLESIGYHTRFVACGTEPGVFTHVYTQAMLPNGRSFISLDPTENYEMGWQPPGMCCWLPKDCNR